MVEINYYNTKLQEYNNYMKNIWKILNDITKRKKLFVVNFCLLIRKL